MYNSVLCYLEETVKKFPDKKAICDDKMEITFSQWKQMSLVMANDIHRRLGRSKCPVLVYLPKSVMTLVSFAAVLYSGNFYTPTDVKFPYKKVEGVLECLEPELIISDQKSAKKLVDNGISESAILYIEDMDFEKIYTNGDEFLEKIIDTDLAYVFFTSGSTGVPKGVGITQKSIVDYIDWASEEFDITEKEVIANQAPFYFDNSILDIYLCMSKGAQLFITPEKYFSFSASLIKYLEEKRINFIFWVPSALIGLANSGLLSEAKELQIKKVLFCGEVMPNRHLNIWRNTFPDVVYANLYGPTEITDVCSYYRVNREFQDDEPLPIGIPCKNTDILLLDEANHQIQEKDVMGELCVRGTSLAIGYYRNPEKTKEVFVQNPCNTKYEEKIYRTGDLAHYNEYGEIMFDGRKDFQIKHKGYRIELGEIETAVLSMNEVRNACCIYDTENSKIWAFYTLNDAIDFVVMKKNLYKVLPKYMVPEEYVELEEMPLNDNGKINRRMLHDKYVD